MAEKFLGLMWFGLMLGSTQAAQPTDTPRDRPYPGTLTLRVDATDLDHRIYRIHESIPVGSGALTLYYPKWLPGNHAPTGPIALLAGLKLSANNQPLAWQRDPVDMYSFHVDVPRGVRSIEAEFQFTSPTGDDQGRRVVTPDLLQVQWEKSLLYPAGYYASRIDVDASITLPQNWAWASALELATRAGSTLHFQRTTLETLVDSPLFAGHYNKRVALDDNPRSPVYLNAFADRPAQLAIKDEQLEAHRNLIREMDQLYGSRHFHHYDYLLAVSDNASSVGLEHHQSSEDGVPGGYFIDWDTGGEYRDLLAHEMTHSWNGKFRRPADLWTPNYNVPMRDSLLWVYEGQTEFWGDVLAARSGLWTSDFAREALAQFAAQYQLQRAGRSWRSLADTTSQPIIDYKGSSPFESWQRDVDYYTEGLLIWLDADMQIRALSNDQRSLDDFARAFFGVQDGRIAPLTYTYDDVISTLNGIASFNWRDFFDARLQGHGPDAPLGGITRGGWELAFTDQPNAYQASYETRKKRTDFGYSLGLAVANEGGEIVDVTWDGPAFKAGLIAGSRLIAVNGREYSADLLKEAIRHAQQDAAPIELLVKNYDTYRSVKLDYHGGLRYPHLTRIEGTPDRLTKLYAPRRSQLTRPAD